MTTEALGYTRLSQQSDTSIEQQKENIRAYAEANDINLSTILDDGEYSSGFETETREAFLQLRERVSDGSVDAILVNDKRRLARDFDDTMRLILDCREKGIGIHTHLNGELDISDPMNAAIEVIQAASDYESKRREIEKAKEAVEERKQHGCYQGRVPFGLQYADDNCHLERDNDKWEKISLIIDRRRADDKVEQIADDVGVSTATVSRIAERGIEWYRDKLQKYGVD